jgi:hypothetical protein
MTQRSRRRLVGHMLFISRVAMAGVNLESERKLVGL